MNSLIKKVTEKYNCDSNNLIEMLREIQEEQRMISEQAITDLAHELKISRTDVEGPATFYHFFSRTHRGKYTVYLNDSVASEMAGFKTIREAFEQEAGCSFNQVSKDNHIGLFTTHCIGMSDQEPAAIINGTIFTHLTPYKVKKLVKSMQENLPMEQMVEELGDGKNRSDDIRAMVVNNIIKPGEVILSEDYHQGEALKKALKMPSIDVIEEIKNSKLRGRGGAGFPTGMKWGFCRTSSSERHYVICNADEGEPGTFKDRVLLTERPELIFEGMTIAAYAVEAKKGILYLRGEYQYLLKYLEKVLESARKANLLGKNILNTNFNFDIQIKNGAGAYICGEESALIESAETKRGEPRNRPPFPVQSGYKGYPTVVNNPETLCAAAKIILNGSTWFKRMGTEDSTGSKLLSIAGDCAKPGIYEVEFGIKVKNILKMAGADPEKTLACQIGGPSGQIISKEHFDRSISFNDLSTGGAFLIIGEKRDLIEIVRNNSEFFVDESCGFCVPCRAGNVLVEKTLRKILDGFGTVKDLDNLQEWGEIIKIGSRCGLGQTSPNPILSSLKYFPQLYREKVHTDTDFVSQFDMSSAVKESSEVSGRKSKIEELP